MINYFIMVTDTQPRKKEPDGTKGRQKYLRYLGPPVSASFLVLVALIAQELLRPFVGGKVFLLFYPAVFLGALLGGLIAGLIATILATLSAWYFFVPPAYSFVFEKGADAFGLIVFAIMGISFSVFSQKLRSANEKLTAQEKERSLLLEQLQRLDKLKTQFFSNVSHELRTPLTLILGPAEKILSENPAPSLQTSVEQIRRNAQILLKHVNDLLDVAKLEAGKLSVNYSKVDLSYVFRQTVSNFETFAQDRHLALTVSSPDSMQAEVDLDKIQRILINLVSNALKFTPSGGSVHCALEWRGKGEDRKNAQSFCISVCDTGPGIPDQHREAIFERFYQIEDSSIRQQGGTGLGLAIVRDFAILHGGKVTLESPPEGGACFRVEIPLKAPKGIPIEDSPREIHAAEYEMVLEKSGKGLDELNVASSEIVPTSVTSQSQLILVVEDNVDMNRYICEALSAEYRIEAAFNGKEGLEKAIRLHPALILTDVMMPLMSGAQMFREIKKHRELDDVPVIALTAKADDELRIALLREGVHDYIVKPFVVEELRARVANLIRIKKVQFQLKLAEEKFRNLLDSAPDAFVIVNKEGVIEIVNRQAEFWFGYERSELIGKLVEVLLPERFRLLHVEKRNLYVEQPKARPMGTELEIFARRKNGSEFPVDVSLSSLETEHGTVITAAIRDVTERKKLEREQRFHSDLSKRLSESLDYKTNITKLVDMIVPDFGDFSVIFDLKENQEPRIRAGTHRDPEKRKLIEKFMASFLPNPRFSKGGIQVMRSEKPVLVSEVTEPLLDEAILDETSKSLIFELGLRSYIEVPMVANNRVLAVLAVGYGESNRKFVASDLLFYEELARRAALSLDKTRLYQEAQIAIQTREDVLAIVSHDLKNPLTVIGIGAQLLAKMRPENAQLRASLEKIAGSLNKAVHLMQRLITSILDFAKIQSGTFTIEPKEEELFPIIESLTETMKPLATVKAIQLSYEIEEKLPSVTCDRDRVMQVLSNLVGNAIKFSPKNSSILIRAGMLSDKVCISVRDNGPGIEPEQLAHVFERYWQAKSTAQQGTGLGLSIVKGIVTAHHGKIWVESKSGEGSTFFFTLPIQAQLIQGLTTSDSIQHDSKLDVA